MNAIMPYGINYARRLCRMEYEVGPQVGKSAIMDVVEVLEKSMQEFGWSQDELADNIKSTQGSVSRYLKRDRVPDGQTMILITALAKRLGMVGGFAEGGETLPVQFQASAANFSFVPRYKISAGAGTGRFALDQIAADRLAFRTDWLRDLGLTPERAGLITASGDSMSPTIPDGAIMLVDLTEGQPLKNGYLYIVVLGGDVLVKRLARRIDGSVELISDNPAYPKDTIPAEHLDTLLIPGRVVWIGHSI